MCRLYRSKDGDYARVCARVRGLRGFKMDHDEALSRGWRPGGHVQKGGRHAGAGASGDARSRAWLLQHGGIWGSCSECGEVTRDEVCDWCKPAFLERHGLRTEG